MNGEAHPEASQVEEDKKEIKKVRCSRLFNGRYKTAAKMFQAVAQTHFLGGDSTNRIAVEK